MYIRPSDRRALLFVIAVVLAVWAGVVLDRLLFRPSSLLTLDEVAMDTIGALTSSLSAPVEVAEEQGTDVGVGLSGDSYAPETFAFDPNTADSTTLMRLGLTKWQVRNIYKYRARGGRFHEAEEFKYIYGMTPEVYDRLAPYIRIDKRFRYYDQGELAADRARSYARNDSIRAQHGMTSAMRRDSLSRLYPRQEKFMEIAQLDLNTVDTTTLKKVPGIGSVRAAQIVRLRDRLGGFVSVDQLAEISSFPVDELSVWFKVEAGSAKRLNINSATVGELARHPYIGLARARAIEAARRGQGRIRSLDELRLLPDFYEATIRRIEPYISY